MILILTHNDCKTPWDVCMKGATETSEDCGLDDGHTFSPSTGEAEAGGSLSSGPAWSTERVQKTLSFISVVNKRKHRDCQKQEQLTFRAPISAGEEGGDGIVTVSIDSQFKSGQ